MVTNKTFSSFISKRYLIHFLVVGALIFLIIVQKLQICHENTDYASEKMATLCTAILLESDPAIWGFVKNHPFLLSSK